MTNAALESTASSSSLTGTTTGTPKTGPTISPIAQRSLWRAWWPAVVWIGIIAFESTDFFSSEHTGSMLYRMLTWLFGYINLHDFLVFHHYLRKMGHVVGYGMLGLLLWRGWRATLKRNDSRTGWTMTLAWLGTVFVASMDEWHQSFIPSRTGTPWDVLLDSVAGVGFLAVGWWWIARRNRERKS